MIPREETRWFILGIVIVSAIKSFAQTDKLEYDTSDWIPVTPSVSGATLEQQKIRTEAVDRISTLEIPQSQKFVSNQDYEDIKNRQRPQHQQFITETVYSQIPENAKPRKIHFPSDYKFESQRPSSKEPLKLHSKDTSQQYWRLEQTPTPLNEQNFQHTRQYETSQKIPDPKQSAAQNYYITQQQIPNQRPVIPQRNEFLNVPNLDPQVPAVDAPNIYERFNIPFNRSFYESLNPTFINNDFYAAINETPQISFTLRPTGERGDVQLVYVPVENLNQGKIVATNPAIGLTAQPTVKQTSNFERNKQERFLYKPNFHSTNEQLDSQSIYNNIHPQGEVKLPLHSQTLPVEQKLAGIRQDYLQQSLQATKLQQQFKDETFPNIVSTTTTAPRSDKKRKPHQPPLAVYLSETQADISEVLSLLKDAKSISVQDAVSPNTPKIFVGPSNLKSTDGYTKFPLPYLNNVNGKRVNPKIEQLPFFVAPLNYKAPLRYSKIPLPSPHVGSVVVSTANEAALKTDQPDTYENRYKTVNQEQYRPQHENTQLSSRYNSAFQSTPNSNLAKASTIPTTRITLQTTKASEPTRAQNIDVEGKLTELPNLNPLELAINEFELDQINTKFGKTDKKLAESSNSRPDNIRGQLRFEQPVTSSTRSRNRNEDEFYSTTERFQSRRRGKPRQNVRVSSTTTTLGSDPQRFTVLEEFQSGRPTSYVTNIPVREPTTTQIPQSKFSNIQNINDYTETGSSVTSPSTENASRKPFSQYLLETVNDYRNTFETTTQRKQITPPYENEDIQSNGGVQQFVTSDGIRYSVPNFETDSRQPQNVITNQFDYTTRKMETPYTIHSEQFSEEISAFDDGQDQLKNNKQENFGAIHRTQSGFNTITPSTISEEKLESQTTQSEQSNLYQNIGESEEIDNMFISPLQDTAVRSLLQPNLLAPGYKNRASSGQDSILSSSTRFNLSPTLSSTEVEASSTVRTRGRTRGRKPTTPTSTRVPGRRRPAKQTTEKIDIESYSEEELDSTILNTKRKFRTRGRPAHANNLEISSTTESALKVINEPSFLQFNSQIIDELPIDADKLNSGKDDAKEYQQLHSNIVSSTPKQFMLEYENTSSGRASTAISFSMADPELDIQKTTRPATSENQIRYQNILSPEKTSIRPTTRSRTRGRSRSTTITPRPISRGSTRRTTTGLAEDEEPNIRFVGEIRPKYSGRKTTTSNPETDTETSRSRARGRVRVPGRTRTSPKPKDDSDSTEQITRRSSIVRTRNRGSSHYRAQESNQKDSSEDAGIAEQNYPINFLQKLETASKPSRAAYIPDRQLELDNEDDQSLRASINRPSILPTPEGLANYLQHSQIPVSENSHQNISTVKDEFSNEGPNIVTQTVPSSVSDTSEEIFRELTKIEEDVLSNLDKSNQGTASREDNKAQISKSPAVINTTEIEENPKGDRRGYWKIVKHKVADPLETAESQNYQSVINAYQLIDKTSPDERTSNYDEESTADTKLFTTTSVPKEHDDTKSSAPGKSSQSIFDSIYQMFEVLQTEKSPTSHEPLIYSISETTVDPTFLEELNKEVLNQTSELNLSTKTDPPKYEDAKKDSVDVTTDFILPTDAVALTSSLRSFEVYPWEMKAVKTSTSTEISHETEICYRGKCVMSKNIKKATQ